MEKGTKRINFNELLSGSRNNKDCMQNKHEKKSLRYRIEHQLDQYE